MATLAEIDLQFPRTITTPRLVITRSLKKDVPAIYALLDAHAIEMIRHWYDFGTATTSAAYARIKRVIDGSVAYTIKHDGTIIGFRWFEPTCREYRHPNSVTTGSFFSPAGRGQGFAYECLSAFIDVIEQTTFAGIDTATRRDNVRTQNLFRKCGFTITDDIWSDLLEMSYKKGDSNAFIHNGRRSRELSAR